MANVVRIATLILGLLFTASCAHVEHIEPAPSFTPGPSRLRLHNYADDFHAFWRSVRDLPSEEQTARFHDEMVPLLPGYYAADMIANGDEATFDARIAAQIAGFGDYEDAYGRKVEEFAAALDANAASFSSVFPDFDDDVDIYLIHSLGQLDGGTRELDGEVFLLFGADVMTRVHDWDDETAFFLHELFHIYHDGYFSERDCEAMWCALWSEGLAVYVSAQLEPEAGYDELLLNIPAGLVADTEAQMGVALTQLRAVLDATDEDTYSALFSFGDSGALPPRYGYYLGYLIAAEIGRDRSLDELVRLDHAAVRPLIDAAIDQLLAARDAD